MAGLAGPVGDLRQQGPHPFSDGKRVVTHLGKADHLRPEAILPCFRVLFDKAGIGKAGQITKHARLAHARLMGEFGKFP